jgi:colanic acid biosynthesis glycosyl transferase WcaI
MNYAPEEIGIGPVIAPLMDRLARKVASVEVITTRPHYPAMAVPEKYARGRGGNEEINHVRVRRCKTIPSRKGSILGRLFSESLFCCEILSSWLTGRVRPAEIVVAVCPTILGVLLAPLLRQRGGRVLCIVHDVQSGLARTLGYVEHGPVIQLARRLEKFAFNRVDGLVALSDAMKSSLQDLGVRKPIFVFPPQVDTDIIVPQPEKPSDVPVLLYSGNLGFKQGLFQLLDVAECLEKRGRKFRLIIRGDGTQKQNLCDDIRRRDLKCVTVEPLLPRERLSDGLADGLIHIVPQLPDVADFALPSKIFAIMAAARPFVVTARPGSQLFHIADEVGACICVPPLDTEALAHAVESLLDNRGKREVMGKRGRVFVEMNASNHAVLDRLCDIIMSGAEAGLP